MISHTNGEGRKTEQKVLAQVELFKTFPAFQTQDKNNLKRHVPIPSLPDPPEGTEEQREIRVQLGHLHTSLLHTS